MEDLRSKDGKSKDGYVTNQRDGVTAFGIAATDRGGSVYFQLMFAAIWQAALQSSLHVYHYLLDTILPVVGVPMLRSNEACRCNKQMF